VKVLNSKEIANHAGPESCVAYREVRDEALTGEPAGQPLSRESLKLVQGADAVRLRRGIGSRVGVFLQLLEGRPGPAGGKNSVRVEKRADRVLTEILGGAYPFSGRVPVTEIVDLQLNQVLVGIRIVQRGRHPVTEAYLGFDSELLQTRERRHQVIEGVVFEGGMVKTRMDELLRVIPQPRGPPGDAVIGAVIRHERDAGRLKVDLGANDDGVPIDYFLQSRRLEIGVMERGFNHHILLLLGRYLKRNHGACQAILPVKALFSRRWMMAGTRLRWAISSSNRGQVSRVETRFRGVRPIMPNNAQKVMPNNSQSDTT
jgi:hypothetical protein